MTMVATEDLDYCRGRALRPNSLLSMTLRFAKPELQNDLLILHTVLGEIRAIPFEVSQPEPAMAKLAWWETALMEANTQRAQHPAIRALGDSGLIGRISDKNLSAYVRAVAGFSTGQPVEHQDELLAHAINIGGLAANLEQSLEFDEPSETSLIAGVCDFMTWCLANFDRLLVGECWWLPLDVQARFGLNAKDLHISSQKPQLMEALVYQSKEVLKRIQRIADELEAENSDARFGRHLQVCKSVNLQRLKRLANNPSRFWPVHNRPGDTFVAWWSAMRHRQQTGF